MKRTTIILLFAFFTGFLSAQSSYHVSLAPMTSTSLNRLTAGAALTFEDEKFQMIFGASVDDQGNPFIQIKPGLTILKEGKGRLLISPLWLKGGEYNEFVMAHGFAWTRPIGDKTTINLGLSIKNKSAAYKPFAWPKLVGYSLAGFGGLKDGLVEGFEFDGRKSWERKLGVSPHSQRGSESWRSVYIDGNPDLGFKSKFHEWMGAWDWYHRNDDYRKLGYILGGISVGIGGAKVNTKWWHYALDFGVSWAVSATTKSIGMKYIRN